MPTKPQAPSRHHDPACQTLTGLPLKSTTTPVRTYHVRSARFYLIAANTHIIVHQCHPPPFHKTRTEVIVANEHEAYRHTPNFYEVTRVYSSALLTLQIMGNHEEILTRCKAKSSMSEIPPVTPAPVRVLTNCRGSCLSRDSRFFVR